MKLFIKIQCVLLALLLFSCTDETIDQNEISSALTSDSYKKVAPTVSKIWEFNDLKEWEDATQVGVPNYNIEDGNLRIFTSPNTWDRTKIKSVSTYTTGTYSWRVYIPEIGVGDMTSIGAFLYNDDTHELDFEIGYGAKSERNALKAAPDDLIAYMTSQANPFKSTAVKIKRGQWYTLSIQLTLNTKNKTTSISIYDLIKYIPNNIYT